MQKYIYSYLLSLFSVTTVLVYGIELPRRITGETALVKEYYYKNYMSSLVLDIVLVFIYLWIAWFVMRKMNVNTYWKRISIVALVTACISGAFYLYFISNPKTSSFFSKWFHTVQYKAVIYDVILVSAVYMVYHFIESKL